MALTLFFLSLVFWSIYKQLFWCNSRYTPAHSFFFFFVWFVSDFTSSFDCFLFKFWKVTGLILFLQKCYLLVEVGKKYQFLNRWALGVIFFYFICFKNDNFSLMFIKNDTFFLIMVGSRSSLFLYSFLPS